MQIKSRGAPLSRDGKRFFFFFGKPKAFSTRNICDNSSRVITLWSIFECQLITTRSVGYGAIRLLVNFLHLIASSWLINRYSMWVDEQVKQKKSQRAFASRLSISRLLDPHIFISYISSFVLFLHQSRQVHSMHGETNDSNAW